MSAAAACELRDVVISELKTRVPEMDDVSARDLEVGVYNWALQRAEALHVARNWRNPRFRTIYASRGRMIIANMDPKSYVGNVDLADRVVDKHECLPHEVAFMSADRMFPQRWKRALEVKQQRDAYISNPQPAAVTDQFRCNRCRQHQCTYYELQTRSCNEPASIFMQCLVCHNRWRIG